MNAPFLTTPPGPAPTTATQQPPSTAPTAGQVRAKPGPSRQHSGQQSLPVQPPHPQQPVRPSTQPLGPNVTNHSGDSSSHNSSYSSSGVSAQSADTQLGGSSNGNMNGRPNGTAGQAYHSHPSAKDHHHHHPHRTHHHHHGHDHLHANGLDGQEEDDNDGSGGNDSDGEEADASPPTGGVGLSAAFKAAQSKAGEGDDGTADAANGQAGGSGKKKAKKRNRKPSSCGPCRRKKLRCDRQSPCGACVLRGEPNSFGRTRCLCKSRCHSGLLGRADNDTADLKAQVDRLQGLVDMLIRTPQVIGGGASAPPSYNSPSEFSELSSAQHTGNGSNPFYRSTRHSSFVSQFEHPDEPHSAGAGSDGHDPTEDRHDLKGSDLAEALSHLAISHVTNGGEAIRSSTTTKDGPVVLEDAKAFVNLSSHFGLADDPFGGGTAAGGPGGGLIGGADHLARYRASEATVEKLSSLPSAAPPSGGLATVLAAMPTDQQAKSALSYYVRFVDWYLHPLHLPTFMAQCQAMKGWKKGEEDPFFLATFLAVIGIGVAMQPPYRAARDGFGTPQQRDELADKFLQASMNALTVGKFLDNPSLEAIRALLVINTHYVFLDSGEHTGSGMGLLSLAVQIALQLGLHRDPDKTPGKFGPVETEERRRLFWTLCSFEWLASSALGRSYSIFNLDNIDAKLPRDLDDDEMSPAGIHRRPEPHETVMTSLIIRMKIGIIAKRISDRAFGIRAVSYATVMELDRELRKLERELPPHYQLRYDEPSGTFALPAEGFTLTSLRFYMIHISFQQELMRLHRPFLIKATTSTEMEPSRRICVRAARIILAIQRQPACQQNWAGLLYKSISAAIVLAIDLLQEPHSTYSNLYRAEINAIVTTLRQFQGASTLCRKGSRVLEFLVERERNNLMAQMQERASKRLRPAVEVPSSVSAVVDSLGNPTPQVSVGAGPINLQQMASGSAFFGMQPGSSPEEVRRKVPRQQRHPTLAPVYEGQPQTWQQNDRRGYAGPQADPDWMAHMNTGPGIHFDATSTGPTSNAAAAYAALAAASNMGAFAQPPSHQSGMPTSLTMAPSDVAPPGAYCIGGLVGHVMPPPGHDSIPAGSIPPTSSPLYASAPAPPNGSAVSLPSDYNFDFMLGAGGPYGSVGATPAEHQSVNGATPAQQAARHSASPSSASAQAQPVPAGLQGDWADLRAAGLVGPSASLDWWGPTAPAGGRQPTA